MCGGAWTTSGGASAPPVSGVPAYMGVVVATSVTKSGSVDRAGRARPAPRPVMLRPAHCACP
jgi:hypothetical protein